MKISRSLLAIPLLAMTSCQSDRRPTSGPEEVSLAPRLTAGNSPVPVTDYVKIRISDGKSGAVLFEGQSAWAAKMVTVRSLPPGTRFSLRMEGLKLQADRSFASWWVATLDSTVPDVRSDLAAWSFPVPVRILDTLHPAAGYPTVVTNSDSTRVSFPLMDDSLASVLVNGLPAEIGPGMVVSATIPTPVGSISRIPIKLVDKSGNVTLDTFALCDSSISVTAGPRDTTIPHWVRDFQVHASTKSFARIDSVTVSGTPMLRHPSVDNFWTGRIGATPVGTCTLQVVAHLGSRQAKAAIRVVRKDVEPLDSTLSRLSSRPGNMDLASPPPNTPLKDTVAGSTKSVLLKAVAAEPTDSIRFNGSRDSSVTLAGDSTRVRIRVTNLNGNSIEYLVDILRMDLASLPSPKASRVGLVDTGTIVLFSCDSSGVTIQTSKDTALGWSSLQTNALGIQTSTSLWVRATKPMHTPSPAVKFNWFLKTVGLPAPRVSLASGPVDSSQTALLACDSMGVSYQWSADTTLGWTSMDADTFVVSQAGSYWFRAVKPRHNASPAVRMTWTIRGLEADAQEPDNSRQTAVLIAANGPAVFHSIMPGDEDWVRFNMPAGKAFRVSASGRPDLTVELFRDTATKPATLDSGTIVSRTILNTATIRWYARISGSGGSTGSYKVQLASWDSAAADASEPDDDRSAAVPYPLKYVLNRTIHSTTDQDWLYWTSSVGRTGTITLTGSINPKLELFREGTEDPIDVSATGSNSVRYVSGMAQRFYLRVTGANGSIGTYQLELDSRDTTLPDEFDPCEPNNTPGTAYPITLGTPLSAKSDVGTDWFVTPTLSPGSYQIRFAAGDMWNCAFVAYTATQDGETIATKTLQACSGGTWTQVFSVPATGPVRIQIGNFLADTDYTITLTKK